jgi:putative DNA primase/helicase
MKTSNSKSRKSTKTTSVPVTIVTATKPRFLTKQYSLNQGALKKTPGGILIHGNAEVVHVDGQLGFAKILPALGPDQALIYGQPKSSPVQIITEEEWNKQGQPDGSIPRTAKNFHWNKGPGILMLDYDPEDDEIYSRDQLVATLRGAVPGLSDAQMLWSPSASSHIVNADTDEDLSGLKGQRLYILAKDAQDIPRAGEAIINALWAAGHGYIKLSKCGSQLPRTLVDGSVWQSNRFDFAAGAACQPPLCQRRGKPVLIPGPVEVVDTKTAIPNPSSKEKKRIDTIRADAKEATAGEAKRVREEWVEARVAEMTPEGADEETRAAARDAAQRAVEGRELCGDFIIHVQVNGNIVSVTVSEILNNAEKYDELLTLDPLVPDYKDRKLVGKLFLKNGRPALHSFAYGERTFKLFHHPPAPKSGAKQSLTLGSDVEIARSLNLELTNIHGKIVVSEGRVWRHIKTHWTSVSAHELRQAVYVYDGATFGEKGIVKLHKGKIDSILNEFFAMHENPDYFSKAPNGLNCLSGFITFSRGAAPLLEPHSPDHRCRHVIQGKWSKKLAKKKYENSLLKKFLDGCFKGDADADAKIDLIGEVAGAAALGNSTRLMKPKAVVLKGVTAENGKSQVLDLMRGLLPDDVVSAIPLSKMNDERHLCGLVGISLNASDELTSALAIASDTFKQVITGEPVTARDVYKSGVTFRPMAQHIYATNTLPTFKGGMDRGVLRRLLVLEFDRTIPEKERIEHIGERIVEEEMDLLLDFAVKGAQRLINQRGFTEPKSSKKALRDWQYGADPVLAWLECGICLDPNAETIKRHAYNAFKEWAIAEGYRENTLPAIHIFTMRVKASGKGITDDRTNADRYFVGFSVKPEDF